MSKQNQKFAFLDRDGVVNIDYGYVYQIEHFIFSDKFFLACQQLALHGYALVIVTNQSGIARGYYSEADFSILSTWLTNQFAANGLVLDAIYHCPHSAGSACDCRKPAPGMILQHLTKRGALAKDCIMFGDKPSDAACAVAAGLGHFFMIDLKTKPSHFYDTVVSFVAQAQITD